MHVGGPVRKPPRLSQGDTVGIIAPASPLDHKEYLLLGKDFLENQGYRVKIDSPGDMVYSFSAGSNTARVQSIHRMFEDPEIKAVICLRGGYGSLQLLPYIDYRLIYNNPKIFIGYSDITALHIALQQKAGLVTFHGPMIYPELGTPVLPPYTKTILIHTLKAPSPLGRIPLPPGYPRLLTLKPGQARGLVTGGNLSLVAATLGTPYEINTRGKILFLEDVGESPYRLDRMLTQLHLAGKLHEAAGIIFGNFSDCGEPGHLEVIFRFAGLVEIPSIYGLPAGHLPIQATLPLGIHALLDASGGSLVYLERATT